MKQIILTDDAPAPIGAYSQAVRAGDLLFCSGQIAIDPDSGEIETLSPADQTRQVLDNLKAVVEAAGGTMASIVKTTIYLHEMRDFEQVNEVYSEVFAENPPARATVQVECLPRRALVEIEAIAHLG